VKPWKMPMMVHQKSKLRTTVKMRTPKLVPPHLPKITLRKMPVTTSKTMMNKKLVHLLKTMMPVLLKMTQMVKTKMPIMPRRMHQQAKIKTPKNKHFFS